MKYLLLASVAHDIPAYFRRVAINVAIGSVRSFFSSLKSGAFAKRGTKPSLPEKERRRCFVNASGPSSLLEHVGSVLLRLWKARSGSSILLKVQNADYARVSEAMGFQPLRSVTHYTAEVSEDETDC